ncbi:redoxin domain-containing protein, partial [Singulisphaera rosea]
MAHQRRWRFAVCGLFLGVTGGADSAWGQFPPDFGSYRTAGDFELRDVRSGRIVKLSDSFNPEKPTKNVVVLAFTGVSNPADEQALSRLGQLAETYKGKGVNVLAINSNAHDTAEQVAEHARRLGVSFPVLKDPGNVLADLDLVERTGEVLVISGMREIRYRGAIDDQVGREESKDAPARRYLADALDAVLAGRKVAMPVTKVVGSPLDRVKPEVITKSTPRVRA